MRRTILLVLLAALVAAAPAEARQAAAPWATVNVCDTAAHPNQIGIRGSMPGLKRKTRMTMRFRVQYLDDGRWRLRHAGAPTRGISSWRPRARAASTTRAGRSSSCRPKSGGAYQLRGVVNFTWKRKGQRVRRERQVTTAGHPGTAGADPADFSAATCAIA